VRDLTGRFVATVTLAYTAKHRNGQEARYTKTVAAAALQSAVGKSLGQRADRGDVWNIEVTRAGEDITNEFPALL
jgi:hypothetical protein